MGLMDDMKKVAADVAEKVGVAGETIKEKAGEFATEHGDKVTAAVTKAGEFVDEKTGGKVASVTTKVEGGVAKAVETLKSDGGATPPTA